MEITATNEGKKYTKSDAGKLATIHNDHDPNYHHSNKSIQADETSMNTHQIVTGTLDDTLHDVWDDELAAANESLKLQHDAGKLSTYNYEHRLKTIDKQCGGDKMPVMNFVATIGNVETSRQMMDRLGIKYEMREYTTVAGDKAEEPHVLPEDQKKWANLCNSAFGAYVKWINENTKFRVSQYWVHLDEGGAPHAHIETVIAGHTKRGKLSLNSNNAIRETLEDHGIKTTKDTRVNFSKFRDLVDPQLVNAFNDAIKQQGYDLTLNLVRTGRAGGLSMTDYKKIEADRKKVQREIKKNAAKAQLLTKRENQLRAREKEVKQREKAATQREKKVETAGRKLVKLANSHGDGPKFSKDSVEKAADYLQSWVQTNHDELVSMDKQHNAFMKTLQQWHNEYDQREKEMEEREKAVTSREKAVTRRESALKRLLKLFLSWVEDKLAPRLEEARQAGYQQRVAEEQSEREVAEHEADNEVRFADDLESREADNKAFQEEQQKKLRNRRERVEAETTPRHDDLVDLVNQFTTQQKLRDVMAEGLGNDKMDKDTAKINNELQKEAEEQQDKKPNDDGDDLEL